jgi:hypothetical protein
VLLAGNSGRYEDAEMPDFDVTGAHDHLAAAFDFFDGAVGLDHPVEGLPGGVMLSPAVVANTHVVWVLTKLPH